MCNCMEEANVKFAKDYPEANTQIDIPIMFKGISRAKIVVRKLDDKKRKKPTVVFATYCPICGEKYIEGNKNV